MYNPDEDYQVMLAKLKTICQNKNITQYALAKATGMSTSSISCLMRGETKPYIYTVLTICDALNVTIADLLERQGYDENCEEDEDVREMIEAYQCLSPEKKRMLKVYMDMLLRKRQTMRQSLKSTPPIIGDVASCIRPEDYLTMA